MIADPSATPSLARYTHFELIGEGVSAKVYKALDTTTRSPVAVKVLNPHLKTDAISIERFRREIQITRFLGHPQVISIYDLIEAECLALVMEHVPGHDLKDVLRLQAPLAVHTALDFLVQMLRILAVCHRKDVIHRDLKPQNVIVDPEGRLKLLDFGISRMTSLADLTHTGTSLGSPEYMAPELFAANVYDPRTDLYAVGVMAYEMLTGELPFQGDSVAVLFHQHLEAPVPRISARRSDVPVWLDDLVGKLLAKKPYERYQTAEEALGDVEAKRVVSKSLPEIRRRDCVSCSRPTMASLPICTFCGFDELDAFAPGDYEVRVSPQEDPEKLGKLLRRVFRFTEALPKRFPPILISDIDRASAGLVKQRGHENGMYLTVAKKGRYVEARRYFSSILLLGYGLTVLLTALYPSYTIARLDTVPILMTIITTQVLLLWGAFRFFLWAHRRPILARRRGPLRELVVAAVLYLAVAVLSGLHYVYFRGKGSGLWTLFVLGLVAGLLVYAERDERLGRLVYGTDRPGRGREPPPRLEEHAWLRELAPLLAGIHTEPLKIFVSRLIEKYHLLVERAPETPMEIREPMKRLMHGAAQVAGVLSELDTAIDDATLAAWSREYLACGQRLAAGDEDREELERRLAAAAHELRRHDDLEVKTAALRSRLLHLQYAFNSLLGKALVLGVALGAAEALRLEAAIDELRRDLVVCRELRHELREA